MQGLFTGKGPRKSQSTALFGAKLCRKVDATGAGSRWKMERYYRGTQSWFPLEGAAVLRKRCGSSSHLMSWPNLACRRLSMLLDDSVFLRRPVIAPNVFALCTSIRRRKMWQLVDSIMARIRATVVDISR